MAQTIDNIVDPNDSGLTSEMVQFASPGETSTHTYPAPRTARIWAR